ncbi:MAG TPA: IgGFc-binding protein, partial [Polyangiaceae bacterium]
MLASEVSRGEGIVVFSLDDTTGLHISKRKRAAHRLLFVRKAARDPRLLSRGPGVAPGAPIMRIVLLAVTLLASVLLVACASSSAPVGFSPDAGAAADDGGAALDASVDARDSAPGNLTGDASGCQNKCSTDGHTVLDCSGYPVQTCPPDQVCGGGACLDACAAATANKSTIGCDYYSVDPDVIQEGQGACFAAYLANTSAKAVTIGVERAGQTFDATKIAVIPSGNGTTIKYTPLPGGVLPPGQVAIVFLAQSPNPIGSLGAVTCPVAPAITTTDASAHGTTYGSAFHITTSEPVVAYDIFPYGGGNAAMTSATLLVPTSAWDTNYIAVNAFPASQIAAQAGAMPSLDIVAMEDGTTVTINAPVAIQPGTGVAGGAPNTPQTYDLAKGQVLQFTQVDELTGSPIQSNKPIGVWGAASCLNIDPNTCCCDSAHQQIPPVKALGSEYVGVRYRNRSDTGPDEAPPWRLVGAVDGTALTWLPSAPAGAPTVLNEGQVAEFPAAG